MAYIGKTPTVGNFQVCDAISVVNGQAAYTLQVGGANVAPESANHMLVSLNGILQKPGSSFTISGSTMTFASNLATGDVIDFVQILGNVLDIGQPSDDTVTAAKLNNDIISGQTELASEPADTDEFLVSDAGTIKRIDYSLIKGGGITEADFWRLTTDFQSGTGGDITSNLERTDTHSWSVLGTGMSQSSGIFSFPSTGYWKIGFQGTMSHISGGMARDNGGRIYATTDNSSYTDFSISQCSFDGNTDGVSYNSFYAEGLFDVTNTSTHKVKFNYFSSDSNIILRANTNFHRTGFTFIRLGDT